MGGGEIGWQADGRMEKGEKRSVIDVPMKRDDAIRLIKTSQDCNFFSLLSGVEKTKNLAEENKLRE